MKTSVESKSLIVEEAALIVHQERCVALDATRLFSRRVILRYGTTLHAAF